MTTAQLLALALASMAGLACASRLPDSGRGASGMRGGETISANPAVHREGRLSSSGIFFELSGPTDADVVVFIHASGVDRRMWDREAKLLETRFRVVRYDLRSHGRTRTATRPVSPFEDLRSLLDELNIPRATLVGLSAGASVATDFAVAHPGRVTRLVLASPSLGGYVPTERPLWFNGIAQAARAGDAERAARLFSESPIMAIDPLGAPETEAGRQLRTIILENARVWADTLRPPAGLAPPAIDRLAEIRAPTLVIVGERDMIDVHHIANRLTAGISSARKVVIPQAGHMLSLSHPAEFDSALLAFLMPIR